MITEVVSHWPKGPDTDHPRYTPVYVVGRLEVRAGRPGKEAARQRNPNEEDTFPALFEGRRDLEFFPSMETFFSDLYEIGRVDRRSAQLLGALLYRSIHLLDHRPDPTGRLRWSPPATVMDALSQGVPAVSIDTSKGTMEVGIEVYLRLLEVLLVCEDVKYGRAKVGDSGRPSTVTTILSVMATGMGLQTVPKLAYGLVRGRGVVGLAAVTPATVKDWFPDLK